MCTVQDTMEERNVSKNISVTVLGEYICMHAHARPHTHTKVTSLSLSADRGYVYLWPSGETNVSSLLHHTVELSVEIEAIPAPSIIWTKENQTISPETSSVSTTHLTGSR